jgi:hypothetical protein
MLNFLDFLSSGLRVATVDLLFLLKFALASLDLFLDLPDLIVGLNVDL